MPDATASPSASYLALPGSERSDYRGKCLYKTGKCTNERALKTSGTAHNLCDEHRNKQNQHQRKLDAKNRQHKRVSALSKSPKSERFETYPTTSAKRGDLSPSGDVSDDAGSTAPISPPAATTSSVDATVDTSSTMPVLATASSGVMYLPNGPQPPQVSYPFVMQDFDGIVVPLPSYLEGQERIEFRSRIYQKVLDFISEECILRFGAKAESAAVDTTVAAVTAVLTVQANNEPDDDVGESGPSFIEGDDATNAQQAASEESRTSKKVH